MGPYKAKSPTEARQVDPAVQVRQPEATETPFADKATDLQSLRDAVIDAATISNGLWLSYLFVLFYLAIAAGSITHRDLFLANPVRLPFLNVDLPLLGFFVVGPGLFLIVHAYVMLHFTLFAGKVGAFDNELRSQVTNQGARDRLRRQLPSNIFVQLLAGPPEVRKSIMGRMLSLIAQISLVAGPLALLMLFHLQFLPYHHEWISLWQRVAVVTDLILLWILWPSLARGKITWIAWRSLASGYIVIVALCRFLRRLRPPVAYGKALISWRVLRRVSKRGKVVGAALASVAIVILVFGIATFPGEWLEDNLRSLPFVPTLHEYLVGGSIDLDSHKPTSVWSNRLLLPGIDVIDRTKFDSEEKIAALPLSVSLRDRHFEGAVLVGANLSKADLTAASLQGASLDGAQLQGALLTRARLHGASLDGAQLQGASLRRAQLQGASLDGAQLQGASLEDAQLQGASLFRTSLLGASLSERFVSGGYSYSGAQFQGALLNYAQLQGASLAAAQLQGASLRHVYSWRADPREAIIEDTLVLELESEQKYSGPGCADCIWSNESLDALKQKLQKVVPADRYLDSVLERIDRLDSTKPCLDETEVIETWKKLEAASPSLNLYLERFVDQWRKIACETDQAPYVIRGRLMRWESFFIRIASPYEFSQPYQSKLAAYLLNETQCPGAKGLTNRERAQLGLIANGDFIHRIP
jgi:hypothetical protein